MKTFKYAGTTRGTDGVTKLRTFNDVTRLALYGGEWSNTDINLHELPEAMTKEDAAQWLFAHGLIRAEFVPSVKKSKTREIRVVATPRWAGGAIRVEPLRDELMSRAEARRIRAEFCERVRVAYEAN